MRPPRNCECCSTVPQEQLGDTTNFFCGRDVLLSHLHLHLHLHLCAYTCSYSCSCTCTMHQEENLQAAMLVTKKARAAWPTGAINGRKKKNMNRIELGKIKPSELIEKDSEINSSTDENDLQDPNANVFDI